MRILLCLHHYLDSNQGAAGVTLSLGAALEELGCAVDYFGFDQAFPNQTDVGVSGCLRFPWLLASFLTRQSQTFDVMDISTGDSWVWSKRGRPGAKKDHLLVTRSHGLEHRVDQNLRLEARTNGARLSWKYPLYHGGFRLWEVTASLRCADLALLLNKHDRDYAINTLHVEANRTRVVDNGIPSYLLNLPFLKAVTTPDKPVRLAQIGSYIPRKGIHYAQPALNAILARHPNVKITFLGTGCPEAQVHSDFEPAVRDQITVVPRYQREELPKLLKGYDILLFPSLSEGFSLALPEAMACGLVPVATAIPGNVEIAQDGQNALLVPPRDSQAIEQALDRMIVNHPLRERLRCSAYATAQRYGWKRIAAETLALYEEGLRARRRSS